MLQVISNESSFLQYLKEIRKFPSLTVEEEYELSKKYNEDQDMGAAHKLVTSHLKLVAKIAVTFKGYGLPLIELVSEGTIGLMQAIKKFNVELGYRLSTYAMWWIKASIHEYILRSWSLVKLGTTVDQKKLFFNLGKIKRKLGKLRNINSNNLSNQDISIIASELNVSEKDVKDMNSRMSNDISLNKTLNNETTEELIDFLPEMEPNQEIKLMISQDFTRKKRMLYQAMNENLDSRQKDILCKRMLNEPPLTLEELSQEYGVSRERIRQIADSAFKKLKDAVIKIENMPIQKKLLNA